MRLQKKLVTKKRLLLAGLVGVILAGLLFTLLLRSDNSNTANGVAEVITHSTDTPNETKPGDDYNWKGGANDPKKIIIPSLSIDSYVQNVGIDQNKEVAVPNNIHLAGWFVDSVRPGEKGLSIIDGHLNGRGSDGIFIKLGELAADSTFTIVFGDNTKKTFKINNVQTVSLDKAASVLYSQDPHITNQLNLITCGGNFDSDARLYDKRVIVISELAES